MSRGARRRRAGAGDRRRSSPIFPILARPAAASCWRATRRS